MKIFQRLREDIRTVFEKDPAARTVIEVLTCYPGLHALWAHRAAHRLRHGGFHFTARLLSHVSRLLTGVEIHPGARIGRRVFIDHGMGVVIGETSEIGDDVLIYQGVVLGGTSGERRKRHPTVRDHVVLGCGATLLGPVEIGEGVRVGAGSVVVRPVPPGSTVVGVPAKVVSGGIHGETDLDHGTLPDPVVQVLADLRGEIELLRRRIESLEEDPGGRAGPERPQSPSPGGGAPGS